MSDDILDERSETGWKLFDTNSEEIQSEFIFYKMIYIVVKKSDIYCKFILHMRKSIKR